MSFVIGLEALAAVARQPAVRRPTTHLAVQSFARARRDWYITFITCITFIIYIYDIYLEYYK